MSKGIRSAVVAFTICFAMAASAQGTVKVGKDGSVKVNSGGTQVDVGGGKVNVQTPGTDTQVEAEGQDTDEADTDSASGSDVDITGSARKETIACAGTTEVSINGSANDITLTGECKSVTVTGSTNKVKAETVGEITVTGSSNRVTWKKAAGGKKKPSVNSTGTGNKVSQSK